MVVKESKTKHSETNDYYQYSYFIVIVVVLIVITIIISVVVGVSSIMPRRSK